MRLALTRTIGVLLALVAATDLSAQKDRDVPRFRIDPYTRNDPKALEKLGYTSYAPIPFGQRGTKAITSEEIDTHLDYAEILWIETAHFRLGTTLDNWAVPLDPDTKAKIRDELTRLKERSGLSRINPKTRVLDRWLRAHLFAQRLEEHYAEMLTWFGMTEEDFPADAEARAKMTGRYAGEGPYLGQKDKYLFLLFERNTTYQDYLQAFIGRRTAGGQQWNFKDVDSLLYACAADNPEEDGRLKDDSALHGHVIHALTHNLINGFLHYNYDLPVWMREGPAHWFERRISPRFNSFTRSEGAAMLQNRQWRWEIETRKLLGNEKFAPFTELMTWRDFGQMDFPDHVMAWSRWDYLMSLGKEKFGVLMQKAKSLVDPTTGVMRGDVVEGCREALREAYQLSPLTLDERWKEWVLESYPTR
jgi:hypothetical protein